MPRRSETAHKAPLVDGSTSRFALLALSIVSATVCAVQGTIDAAAYTGIVGVIAGGLVHASGTKQGSEATSDPPPET